MGTLFSCCCCGERDRIEKEPLHPNDLSEKRKKSGKSFSSSIFSRNGFESNTSIKQIGFTFMMTGIFQRYSRRSGRSVDLTTANDYNKELLNVCQEFEKNAYDLKYLGTLAHAKPKHWGYQRGDIVSQLNPPGLAQSVLEERVQEYERRLEKAGHMIAEKARISFAYPYVRKNLSTSLSDLGTHADAKNAVLSEAVNDNDIHLISEMSARALDAYENLQIEHYENVTFQCDDHPASQYTK